VTIGNNTTILSVDRISKYFGENKAVNELTLEIKKGEIFTLLGPSGCGKTTTLRQIAGLENPDEGEIHLHNRILVSPSKHIVVPPELRNMGMVFQSYAIWPHMTVFEIVAYPLRTRRVPKAEIQQRVTRVLEQVGLEKMENRPGTALSGGQQQRVALARALVYEPEVLLLDEPFSNLDMKLREQMRVELKQLQRRVGVTVILVTHDQLEALGLSDRIAVMNAGSVEQVGTPRQLYENPKTPFVRDFIGTNVSLEGRIAEVLPNGEIVVFVSQIGGVNLRCSNKMATDGKVGQAVKVTIRPEDIQVRPEKIGDQENQLEATPGTLLFMGDRAECHFEVLESKISAYVSRKEALTEGQRLALYLPKEALTIWETEA